MINQATVYRLAAPLSASLDRIENAAQLLAFVECGKTQMESRGFVPPRGEKHGALVEAVAGHYIVKLMTETRSVPGTVVKRKLAERLDKIEQETGRRPKGKASRELKEEIVQDLLPHAFPKQSAVTAWIDSKAHILVVGTASSRRADQVVSLLVDMVKDMSAAPLLTTLSPAVGMAAWLTHEDGAPAGFTIDRELELKQPDSEKSTVRYSRHALDLDEIGDHIRQGKVPTKLALTWNSRVSFVLTELQTITKIKLLDVVMEAGNANPEDKGFDADAAITTGELGRLIPDLIDALGGEFVHDLFVPKANTQEAA